MTKLNSGLKFRIIALVSFAIIVIGMALGTIFHFISNGFFNYGGEYSSYKSVSVSYSVVEVNGEDFDIDGICTAAFEQAGVKYYAKTEGATFSDEKQIEYRFAQSVDNTVLEKAVSAINVKINESLSQYLDGDVIKSKASLSEHEGLLGGGFTLSRAAIAIAVIVAVQLIYTMIRFRFSATFTAIIMDLHNLALFAAVLAICRIPVTSSVLVYAVILTLVTIVGVTFTLERIKRNSKENAKLSVGEVVSLSAHQTLKANIALPAFLAVAALLFFAGIAISSLSIVVALVPMALAFAAFVVAIYGNVLLAPYLYIFVKNTGSAIAAKPSQKKGN